MQTLKDLPPEKSVMIGLQQLQTDVKTLLPDGAYIWRGNNKGTWNCHYKPWRRRSFSAVLLGEREAIHCCLRHLWTCYLFQMGLGTAACPVVGLFVDVVAAGDVPPVVSAMPPVPVVGLHGSATVGGASSSADAPAPHVPAEGADDAWELFG